jgi:multicomponent Na+:H+ antiporter subunit E
VKFFLRLLFLACLWIVLTEGDASSMVLGGWAIALATATDVHLHPQIRAGSPSLLQVVKVLARIPSGSVKAGLDVAMRAFRPSLPVRPGLVRVPIPLGDPAVQVGTAYLTTILPGTVCVALETTHLRLHLIDMRRPVGEHVARIARDLGGTRHA